MVRLTKLTKLFRMIKLGAYLEYVEVVIKFNPGLLRVFKLIVVSILMCHWFGCSWWLISDLEIQDLVLNHTEVGPALAFSGATFYTADGVPNDWHPPYWLKYEASLLMKYMHAFFWGAGMVSLA